MSIRPGIATLLLMKKLCPGDSRLFAVNAWFQLLSSPVATTGEMINDQPVQKANELEKKKRLRESQKKPIDTWLKL